MAKPERFRRGGREHSDFEQKIIDIRRVARVVAGGRRFSFRVTIVLGNRKGEVGVGLGKAADTAAAIEKASRLARKTKIKVPMTKEGSLAHEVVAKFKKAKVAIIPTYSGRGLVAGSAVRIVLDLAGVKDVTAKVITPSKNKLNIARATMAALKKLEQKNEPAKNTAKN